MPSSASQLFTTSGKGDWNQLSVSAPVGIQLGVPIDLLVSDAVTLSGLLGDFDAIQIGLFFEDFAPDLATQPGNYQIAALGEVSADNGNSWDPVSASGSPINRSDVAPNRQLRIQPNLVVVDPGIDELIPVGNLILARVGRFQARLADLFRMRLVLTDQRVGQSDAFTSVKVSGRATLYGV